ncbi:MAG TPA: hypothetical protein VH092_03880 [Urbifossiella sp.]|jgi:hypothetical protein|nr:hypothetical protein [Urbifossiella sp.]
MLDRLTVADFDPLRGSRFRAEVPGAEGLDLELLEVKPLPGPTPRPGHPPRRGPFSLQFLARTPLRLPQGTYPLAHDALGRLDVFLVPVGRDADGLVLEAIFT